MKLFVLLLGHLPLQVRIWLGRFLGSLFSYFPTRDSRIAKHQLRLFLPDQPIGGIHREVYANLGQTFFETINLKPLLDKREHSIEFDNWSLVEKLKNRGFIVLTAHVSNWDLLAAYFIKHGLPLSTIARKTRNQVFHQVITDIRTSYGIKSIWRENPGGGAREILKDLKSGRGVAALIDQDTNVASEMIDFFGQAASTPSTLVSLARKLEIPLVSAFIVREAKYRYRIEAEELSTSDSDTEILKEFNFRLEDLVRKYPPQWVWLHKRWRTTKDGSRMSSKNYLSFLAQNLRNTP